MNGLITLLLFVSGLAVAGQGQSAPPFTTTAHGLLREGRPFFWLGDTGWLLLRMSPQDVQLYLDDRAAKGFTVIQMMAIRTDPRAASPISDALTRNCAGEGPFQSLDPVTLNEADASCRTRRATS